MGLSLNGYGIGEETVLNMMVDSEDDDGGGGDDGEETGCLLVIMMMAVMKTMWALVVKTCLFAGRW